MPPIENIGDNIDKAADGFEKVSSTIKSNPIVTAIVIIIAAAAITVWSIIHSTNIATDAAAKQRDKDDAYYMPIIRGDDSAKSRLQDTVIYLKLETEMYKQKFKKLDSLNR